MKKFQLRSLMFAMLAGLFFLSVHSYAQEGPPDGPPPGPPPEEMQQQESPNEAASHELKQLAKKLKLTEDQKTSIRPIIVKRHERMAALFSNQSSSTDAKREQISDILESSDNSIRKLLNDEQKVQFDKLQKDGRRDHGPPNE